MTEEETSLQVRDVFVLIIKSLWVRRISIVENVMPLWIDVIKVGAIGLVEVKQGPVAICRRLSKIEPIRREYAAAHMFLNKVQDLFIQDYKWRTEHVGILELERQ